MARKPQRLKDLYADVLRLRILCLTEMLEKISVSMSSYERRTPQSNQRDEGPNN